MAALLACQSDEIHFPYITQNTDISVKVIGVDLYLVVVCCFAVHP